jgi:hypothetical protein
MCPTKGFGSVKSVIMVDDGGFAMGGALDHWLFVMKRGAVCC